jgi:1,4-dihydroxy-2-naphthoate octaprenyltransferase
VETDAKAGKRTTAVRFGRGFARAQFTVAHVIAVAVVLELGRRGGLSSWEAVGMAAVGAAAGWQQVRRLRTARGPGELIALLGLTGRYLAFYAGALAVGLVW